MVLVKAFHQFAFGSLSLVASNTAPTMADNNSNDDTSNGNKNSLNNTCAQVFYQTKARVLQHNGV
jgi:hypothetical protein